MSTAPPPMPAQGNPYGQGGFPPEPKKRSGCGCVLMVLAAVAVVGLVICLGCAGFTYWGVQQAFTQMKAELAKNEVVQEHIGDIESTEIDWSGAMQPQPGGEQVFRMKVKGTKSDGTILMKTSPGSDEPEFLLEMPSGETFPLEVGMEPDNGTPPPMIEGEIEDSSAEEAGPDGENAELMEEGTTDGVDGEAAEPAPEP